MARSVIAEIVDMAGFRAIPESTAEAALDVLESTRVCAVLSDIRIPDSGSGIHFIRTVMRRWPEVPLAVSPAIRMISRPCRARTIIPP